ncbi:MAG: GIY-YIG nuclease family protein [Taibaiella sp.]|nr:GIY-YIG nuclease family protein [Taibaiella sp.]
MQKGGYVYIVTNKHHTVLYTGVTSELLSREFKHKSHFYKHSFTDRYNVEYLV